MSDLPEVILLECRRVVAMELQTLPAIWPPGAVREPGVEWKGSVANIVHAWTPEHGYLCGAKARDFDNVGSHSVGAPGWRGVTCKRCRKAVGRKP